MTRELPILSIVIPSQCRTDLLHACLSAVARHAPAGTEIIVVDDGSRDATVSRTAECFADVRVVRLPSCRGFCAAANAGIRVARGEFIELLNDDTEVQLGWAAAALQMFRDPSVGAVAPLVLSWPDGQRIDSAGDQYYVGGVAGKRGRGEPVRPEHLTSREVFGVSASSGFYRRAALVAAGGFPESFGAYFEDVDLSFRLRRAGWRILFEPAARVLHHVSSSYRRQRRLSEQQSCNEERVFWRNLPTGALLRALPAHAAVLLAKAWRRWAEGALTPFLLGRLRLLTEVPEVLRHRRALGPAADTRGLLIDERWRNY